MRAVVLGVLVLAASPAFADDYVVLSAPSDDTGYRAAAARLAEHHGTTVRELDPEKPERLRAQLRKWAPRHVAVVLAPGHLDFAFQRRFLELSTGLDEDPFVDFAFGYVTGATGAEALAFVDAGIAAGKASPREATLGRLSGSAKESRERSTPYQLRSRSPSVVRGSVRGEDDAHDRAFLEAFLPKLATCNAIVISGHGFPDRVVGCMDAQDLAGCRLDGAVVLNVACWTGTTDRWYRYPRRGDVVMERVPADRSLALAMLRTGVSAYVAYTCPRPQGPEMDRELMALVVDGLSVGDARRREYDKTVLGFLGFGERSMVLTKPETVRPRQASRDAIRDIMLEDATGGVLFGDPALRPFVGQPGEDPILIEQERENDDIVVTASCPKHALWLHCDEPAGRMDGEPAMKVYARVALGPSHVRDVDVDFVRIGPRDQEHRVVWAVEEDHGDRFLHLKVVFPRQDGRKMEDDDGLTLRCRVRTTSGARQGRDRGGQVEPPIRRSR
jgi:hypothetical protein